MDCSYSHGEEAGAPLCGQQRSRLTFPPRGGKRHLNLLKVETETFSGTEGAGKVRK